jgi:MFS family permease
MAIFWGGFMWIIMSLIPEIWKALRGQAMSYDRLVAGLVVWTLGGVAVGGFASYYFTRKNGQKQTTKP